MIRKHSPYLSFTLAAFSLTLAIAPLPALQAGQPNVLFISVDDMND